MKARASLEQGDHSAVWTGFQRRGRGFQRRGRKQETELRVGSMGASGAEGFGLDAAPCCRPGIGWLSGASCGSKTPQGRRVCGQGAIFLGS